MVNNNLIKINDIIRGNDNTQSSKSPNNVTKATELPVNSNIQGTISSITTSQLKVDTQYGQFVVKHSAGDMLKNIPKGASIELKLIPASDSKVTLSITSIQGNTTKPIHNLKLLRLTPGKNAGTIEYYKNNNQKANDIPKKAVLENFTLSLREINILSGKKIPANITNITQEEILFNTKYGNFLTKNPGFGTHANIRNSSKLTISFNNALGNEKVNHLLLQNGQNKQLSLQLKAFFPRNWNSMGPGPVDKTSTTSVTNAQNMVNTNTQNILSMSDKNNSLFPGELRGVINYVNLSKLPPDAAFKNLLQNYVGRSNVNISMEFLQNQNTPNSMFTIFGSIEKAGDSFFMRMPFGIIGLEDNGKLSKADGANIRFRITSIDGNKLENTLPDKIKDLSSRINNNWNNLRNINIHNQRGHNANMLGNISNRNIGQQMGQNIANPNFALGVEHHDISNDQFTNIMNMIRKNGISDELLQSLSSSFKQISKTLLQHNLNAEVQRNDIYSVFIPFRLPRESTKHKIAFQRLKKHILSFNLMLDLTYNTVGIYGTIEYDPTNLKDVQAFTVQIKPDKALPESLSSKIVSIYQKAKEKLAIDGSISIE